MTLSDVLKHDRHAQSFGMSLQSLNGNNFFDWFPYIKSADVFSKLSSLYLCIIQQILDHCTHEFGRSLLNINSSVKLIENVINLFFYSRVTDFDSPKFAIEYLFIQILSLDWIEWISELMWNTGINHVENLVMSSLLIKFLDETGRNVYNLDNCFFLKTARFDLEVTRILRASTVNRDQFIYLFVKVSFHDTIQRV